MHSRRTFILEILILFSAPALGACADSVHVAGDFAIRGVVREEGDSLSVATASGTRRLRREEVLFIERTSDTSRRLEIVQKATILLHRIGHRDKQREMEALAELAAMEPGDVFRPLVDALRYHRPEVRRHAAFRLGLIGSYEALDPLIERSLRDSDEGVRDTAFQAARRIGHPKLAVPYVRSLRSENGWIRIRAAGALGEIGDTRAVKYLVQAIALPAGGEGGNPRSFFFSGSEVAFVKDFDVQVAQGAAAADPIVDTVVEGALIDAKVIGITRAISKAEVAAFSSALERLTGRRYGPHPDAWLLWWKTHGSKEASALQR
jgi:hypothetical protein